MDNFNNNLKRMLKLVASNQSLGVYHLPEITNISIVTTKLDHFFNKICINLKVGIDCFH